MKRIAEAASLQAAVYLKTGRVVMPALALLVYLVTFYSIGPADVVSSSVLTALALSLVTAWAGLSFSRSEETVVSQLVQLKLGSQARETAARALLLLCAGAAASAVSFAWPALKNAAGGGTFFTRDITPGDAGAAAALFLSASVMGGAYGALFHPRLFRDTRAAWLIALAGCLAGVFSGVVIRDIPAFARVSPLFPPMYGLITRFDGMAAFEPAALARTIVECWAYAMALFTLKTILLRRVRY